MQAVKDYNSEICNWSKTDYRFSSQ